MMILRGTRVSGVPSSIVFMGGMSVRPVAGGPVDVLVNITEDADGKMSYHVKSGAVYGEDELEFAVAGDTRPAVSDSDSPA